MPHYFGSPDSEAAMPWQLQEAKQRFSELVRRTLEEGPQVVTRHGEEVVVVLSVEEFERLRRSDGVKDFKDFLSSAPDLDRLEIRRDKSPPRLVDLS
jgi:prevent-host-death family protein